MSCNCNQCQKRKYPITDLEAWRKASCFNDAWGFWGWDHDKLRTKGKSSCYSIVRQSGSSHGCPENTLGRDEVARAILEAEQVFRDYLGYSVVPEWHSKTVDGWNWGCNHSWRNSNQLTLPFGNVLAVGQEVFTEIGNVKRGTTKYKIEALRGALPDTFTVKIPVDACVKEDEIFVFIDKAEQTNCNDLHRWRIPADCVTIANGVATITGKSYLLAKPELYENYDKFPAPVSYYNDYSLNPEHLENYVDRLSIQRRTIDSCEGGRAITHKKPCGCSKCCTAGIAICGTCSNVAFCIDDNRAGIVSPLWNFGGSCAGRPDSFCVNFLTNGGCDRDWTADITRLSIAKLCSPICGCAYGCMSKWSEDVAHESAKVTTSFDTLDNPIGTKRGEIEAWKLINRFKNRIFMI